MNKRLLLAAMLLAVSFAAPVTAHASDDGGAKTNDDDPGINAQGIAVNKILKVLQSDPDSASDSCINALKEMHTSQDQLAQQEAKNNNQDLGVARDVVASDMEDVATMCGADARRLCRSPDGEKGKLAQACDTLPDAGG